MNPKLKIKTLEVLIHQTKQSLPGNVHSTQGWVLYIKWVREEAQDPQADNHKIPFNKSVLTLNLPFGPQGSSPVQFSPSYCVAYYHNRIPLLASQYLCKMCISSLHCTGKRAISPGITTKPILEKISS